MGVEVLIIVGIVGIVGTDIIILLVGGLEQHYMVNEQVNSAMVQLVGIQPGDLILEIGPGTGSLTKFLVEAGAHIIAVEKVLYYIPLPTQNQSAFLTC
jgi:precorrin-6B methylase 2